MKPELENRGRLQRQKCTSSKQLTIQSPSRINSQTIRHAALLPFFGAVRVVDLSLLKQLSGSLRFVVPDKQRASVQSPWSEKEIAEEGSQESKTTISPTPLGW